MSTGDNKALVRRYVDEVWNKKNASLASQFIHPKVVNHLSVPEGSGPEGVQHGFTIFHTLFPDLRTEITHLIGEGDMVAVRWRSTGTHKGALKGKGVDVPPTNKQATWFGTNVYRIAEGKIAEIWANVDSLAQAINLVWFEFNHVA